MEELDYLLIEGLRKYAALPPTFSIPSLSPAQFLTLLIDLIATLPEVDQGEMQQLRNLKEGSTLRTVNRINRILRQQIGFNFSTINDLIDPRPPFIRKALAGLLEWLSSPISVSSSPERIPDSNNQLRAWLKEEYIHPAFMNEYHQHLQQKVAQKYFTEMNQTNCMTGKNCRGRSKRGCNLGQWIKEDKIAEQTSKKEQNELFRNLANKKSTLTFNRAQQQKTDSTSDHLESRQTDTETIQSEVSLQLSPFKLLVDQLESSLRSIQQTVNQKTQQLSILAVVTDKIVNSTVEWSGEQERLQNELDQLLVKYQDIKRKVDSMRQWLDKLQKKQRNRGLRTDQSDLDTSISDPNLLIQEINLKIQKVQEVGNQEVARIEDQIKQIEKLGKSNIARVTQIHTKLEHIDLQKLEEQIQLHEALLLKLEGRNIQQSPVQTSQPRQFYPNKIRQLHIDTQKRKTEIKELHKVVKEKQVALKYLTNKVSEIEANTDFGFSSQKQDKVTFGMSQTYQNIKSLSKSIEQNLREIKAQHEQVFKMTIEVNRLNAFERTASIARLSEALRQLNGT